METNQPPVQEQSAQFVLPQIPQSQQRRYNPDELARIVHVLTHNDFFDPEYILLFGKLVGGTLHSDATAYDLLMVVRETPDYDWIRAKRILRYKVPTKSREISYINLYVMTLREVETRTTPFLYFAHAEGELLYCSDHYHFRRPKYPINFAKAYADAKLHYDTFRMLGNELIEQAQDAISESHNMRLAALFSAQAAVYFYHTLYYAYHGQDFDSHDLVIMHERMRTLSIELMLVFDDTHIERTHTLPKLRRFLLKARYELDFDIAPQEMELHLQRVIDMGRIIENCAGRRLEVYQGLSQ